MAIYKSKRESWNRSFLKALRRKQFYKYLGFIDNFSLFYKRELKLFSAFLKTGTVIGLPCPISMWWWCLIYLIIFYCVMYCWYLIKNKRRLGHSKCLGSDFSIVSLMYNSDIKLNLLLNIYFKIGYHLFRNDAKIKAYHIFRILFKIVYVLCSAEQCTKGFMHSR